MGARLYAHENQVSRFDTLAGTGGSVGNDPNILAALVHSCDDAIISHDL